MVLSKGWLEDLVVDETFLVVGDTLLEYQSWKVLLDHDPSVGMFYS